MVIHSHILKSWGVIVVCVFTFYSVPLFADATDNYNAILRKQSEGSLNKAAEAMRAGIAKKRAEIQAIADPAQRKAAETSLETVEAKQEQMLEAQRSEIERDYPTKKERKTLAKASKQKAAALAATSQTPSPTAPASASSPPPQYPPTIPANPAPVASSTSSSPAANNVAAPSIDPVLLKQIQETVEVEIRQRQAAFAKRHTELFTVTDSAERAKREQELNVEEKQSDEYLMAQRSRIEAEFSGTSASSVPVAPEATPSGRAPASAPTIAPTPAPNAALNSAPVADTTLAGFDLGLSPEQFQAKYQGFECKGMVYYSLNTSEVTLPIVRCQKQEDWEEDPFHLKKNTLTALDFYQGRVFRFVTRIPKGVLYYDAIQQLAQKTGEKTMFVHGVSNMDGGDDGCGAAFDFFGGKALILNGQDFSFRNDRNIEEMEFNYSEQDPKEDCEFKKTAEGELVYYKNESIKNKIEADLERAVQDFRAANKKNFSL